MKQYEWCGMSHSATESYLTPHRCSFTFDPDNFPDPKKYLAEIKSKYNVKVCVWSEWIEVY